MVQWTYMARINRNSSGTKQTGVWTESHGFITEKGWKFLVHRNPHWALKACVALFDRQTQDEKDTRTTRWDNQRGFRADDASRGTKLAKRLLLLKRQMGPTTTWRALADEVRAEGRDDLELALFLAVRYRKQCLNIVAQAQEAAR